MQKLYLYGAGINCVSVIKYLGKENIIAVIDSDSKKQGREIEEIRIISLEEYIIYGHQEFILITVYYAVESIIKVLQEHHIYNYAKCPWMQSEFFCSADETINRLDLYKYQEIAFYKRNPISMQIAEKLMEKSNNIVVRYIDTKIKYAIDSGIPILITCLETKEDLSWVYSQYPQNEILELSTIYKRNFRFRNKELEKFKSIHSGKRCFILGNGPSLRFDDLQLLYEKKEICFGVNRIYLAYESTDWRPDYYVAVDNLIIQKDYSTIKKLPGIKFVRHINNMEYDWKNCDTYEFGGLMIEEKQGFSQDIVEGIYSGWTVVYEAIQIAVYMGFDEIYLLGVDMTSGIRSEAEGAHFYKTPDRNENLPVGNRAISLRSFAYAGEVIERMGKKIRNATRGGELEELKRVDFDSLF